MGANSAIKFTILLVLVSSSSTFEVISKTKDQDLRPGQAVRLSCQADSAYEYCRWRNKGRTCSLEWKYKQGKVIVTECDSDLEQRITEAGDYTAHQCAINLTNISQEDAGDWECELEAYVIGWVRGDKDKKNIKLSVSPLTTTTKPTTTTTDLVKPKPSTTTTTATTTTTSSTVSESETTTLIEILSIKYDDEYEDLDNESQPHTSTEAFIAVDEGERDVEIEALPVTEAEEAEAGSSVGLIAGVIVSLLAIILVLTALGVTWHRRRKSQQAIIAYLQTERDDQMASNAFLEEAEYHISIIRDPQNLPLQQQKTIESVVETDKL